MEDAKPFNALYREVLERAIRQNEKEFHSGLAEYDARQLECLLNPKGEGVVWRFGHCDCPPGEEACAKVCPFHAIHPEEGGDIRINETACVGCELCVQECRAQKLEASKDAVAVARALRSHKEEAYALVAPAFLGQFPGAVSPGQLRSALKKAGFDGMIEVALFADVLTLKEALEFDRHVRSESDFQLTSCCCPMWIAMIRKIYTDLAPRVPPAVSPMVAAGRVVKLLYPKALTVFIGPCLAKKAEAREKDLLGAVDYVLTFQETKDIFEIMGIDPTGEVAAEKEHSSKAGRIYARSGGVSEAVSRAVEKLSPDRQIKIRTKAASGVPACKAMIAEIEAGKRDANFFEGMGCAGGCVGGPRVILPPDEGRTLVEKYAAEADADTPMENPHVIEILRRLGFETVESLLKESEIFTRKF